MVCNLVRTWSTLGQHFHPPNGLRTTTQSCQTGLMSTKQIVLVDVGAASAFLLVALVDVAAGVLDVVDVGLV